jgi:hypothetical protein
MKFDYNIKCKNYKISVEMTLDSGQATVIACFVKLQRLKCYQPRNSFSYLPEIKYSS